MKDNMLGEYIRRRRGSRSLRAFAAECGVSHTHIESIEKGVDRRTGKRVSVSMETLRLIGEGIGVDPLFLACLADGKDPARVRNITIPPDWASGETLLRKLAEDMYAEPRLSPEALAVAAAFDAADERTKEIIRLTLHDLLSPPAAATGT